MSFWEEKYAQVPATAPAGKNQYTFSHPQQFFKPVPAKDAPRIAVSPWTTGESLRNIERAGGIPMEISASTPLVELEKCTGLLIPGGRDVDPSLYGERPDGSQFPDKDRDEFEIALIKYAMRHKMAILGICRGHQLLNVAMGGSLIQDMKPHHGYKHPIKISPESKIFSTVKDLEIVVNSLHHQCVKEVGKNMIATAWSPDGTVEVIEHKNRTFVVGVQFHPEMSGVSPRFQRAMDQLIWKRFIRIAKEKSLARVVKATPITTEPQLELA